MSCIVAKRCNEEVSMDAWSKLVQYISFGITLTEDLNK